MTPTFPLAVLALCVMAHDGVTGREGRLMSQPSTDDFGIDLSRALPGEKGGLPAELMGPAARLFGLAPCDHAKSWYAEDRAYAGLNIGNPAISCSAWPTPDRRQLAFAGRIDRDGLSMPVVGYASREVMAGQRPRAVAVYMVGGPGGDIAPGLNDTLPAELVRRGYAVIKLGYSGTRYGSVYPDPDFEVAARQLAAYLRLLATLQPAIPRVVVGESLGAQIVERALTPDVAAGVSGIALVHPLLFSPAAALRNFKDRIGVSDASDPIMTIQSTGRPGTPADSVARANSLRRFASFYPPDALNKDLEHYLAGGAAVPTLLAYGDADTRIGVGLLSKLRARCPAVRVLTLAGVNHTVEEPQARSIADAMERLQANRG